MTPRTLLLLLASIHGLSQTREPVPSFAIQSDPETIYRGLRTKSPIPRADCKLLNLHECNPGNQAKIKDISLRWVNLDDDPDLEAILVSEAPEENTYVAAIFDQSPRWRLVGSYFCHRNCNANTFVSVHKLTQDSPSLLFLNRDLGGSGGYHLALEGFHLRGGKLWPAIEFTQRAETSVHAPVIASQDIVHHWENSLVIVRREYQLEAKIWTQTCTVKTWSTKSFAFLSAPKLQAEFCEPRSGQPIKDKSWPTTLPASPLY